MQRNPARPYPQAQPQAPARMRLAQYGGGRATVVAQIVTYFMEFPTVVGYVSRTRGGQLRRHYMQ